MSKILFHALLSLLIVSAATSTAVAQEAKSKRRPNILIILADDMGYADVGFQGCKDIPTPNIDYLAKNGVRFSSGYVSAPYCSPTRAGLLTGRYQTRFGHEFNPSGPKNGLPVQERTMAQIFRALGYATSLIGKWHLGNNAQMQPTARGFQDFFGFLAGAHPYFLVNDKSILRGTQPVDEKAYLTDALAREAVAYIDKQGNNPFFLYLAFNAVHTPMQAPEKYLGRFAKIENKQRRTYAAMLSAMDDAVGQVLAKLRDKGLEEDTLIFFFSDNGGPTMIGTTINGARNFPLRGSKRQLLEGGVRVPFVIQWKGRLPAGKTYAQPIISLDVLPTALAAASADAKAEWKLDGVNLLPFLDGKNAGPPHAALYWRFGEQMAVRKGDWKLTRYDNTGQHLYNLKTDIGESQDVAAQNPDMVRDLQAGWTTWNQGMVPPLWGAGKAKKKMPTLFSPVR